VTKLLKMNETKIITSRGRNRKDKQLVEYVDHDQDFDLAIYDYMIAAERRTNPCPSVLYKPAKRKRGERKVKELSIGQQIIQASRQACR